MIEVRTDVARAMIDATFVSQHRSINDIAAIRRDLDQSRRAIAASRNLLKRLRQRKADEALREPEKCRVSAFHAEIAQSVFRTLVTETNVPPCEWRNLARSLIFELTGCERVDAALLDWIIRK
ncbi:hypothetical protein C7I87_02400 [Mesorhizobium sp. SARCC-RB16n]|uniref:hypothetical protein n=1 Tax=Mesorhizobium sp. SARCC-RB16n TaxID=2116687 RepID=UPI00122F3E04|nr:hypothetical protein [Mesorhizobium sp. SARCC-RB16n]KAA3452261.1 hypothetical protein C7I87_02400 [Mesorhizobium sp. SARCC-RB16n]